MRNAKRETGDLEAIVPRDRHGADRVLLDCDCLLCFHYPKIGFVTGGFCESFPIQRGTAGRRVEICIEASPGKGGFPMKRQLTKKKKTIFSGTAIFLAILISLGVLVIAHENWSGAREWKRVQEKLIAGGVELSPEKLLREMPEPEQNFASLPLIHALTDFEEDDEGNLIFRNPELVEQYRSIRLPEETKSDLRFKPSPNWQHDKRADLTALAKIMRQSPAFSISSDSDAEAVLEGFGRFDEELNTLEEAAKRPEAVLSFTMKKSFPENVGTPLPYMMDFIEHQKLLLFRAVASLETEDREKARETLLIMRQTARTAGSPPLLIAHLVKNATLHLYLTAVWHGLDDNSWGGEELKWIENELADLPEEHLYELERVMTFEMCAMLIASCDFLKTAGARGGDIFPIVGTGSPGKAKLLLPLIPAGLWDHNKAFGAEIFYDDAILPAREKRVAKPNLELKKLGKSKNPRRIVPMLIIPETEKFLINSFGAAMSLELARVACTVERYKIDRGTYPADLEKLVPEYIDSIPVDLFSENHSPIRYRIDGNRYRIYSVGTNGTDEGGKVVFKGWRSVLEEGDWVWGYEFGAKEDGG